MIDTKLNWKHLSVFAGTVLAAMLPIIVSFFVWCSHMETRLSIIEATQIHKAELKEAVIESIGPLVEDLRHVEKKDLEQDIRLHDLERK